MLPLLSARQLIELASYHALVGKPGVDHSDVPLVMLAAAVMSFFSGEPVMPEALMPHLEQPEQTPDDILKRYRASRLVK